ncbi:hypothetical protein [Agrococcus sp. Ld7]|uniref:hypothetical protein n=1 Tax=Agrococcus sp. Ld7 TaxID=649148 RepID=UPI0038655B50
MSTIKIILKEAFDVIEELAPKAARAVSQKSTKLGAKTRQIRRQIEAKDAELAGAQRKPDRAPGHHTPEPSSPDANGLNKPASAPDGPHARDTWPDVDTEAANAATAAARQAAVESGEIPAPDFGRLTAEYHGRPPADMEAPHGHHIVFKRGVGARQQAVAAQMKEILERNRIDWYTGPHNLTWAPNVAGQHNIANARAVLRNLQEADALGRDAVIEALRNSGRDVFGGRP